MAAFVWLTAAMVVFGCGTSGATTGQVIGGGGGHSASSSAGGGGGADVDAGCGATPTQGCPCATEGQTVDCGHVIHHDGDYVSCSVGSITCQGGTWGACAGENWGTPHYATPASACTDNPCDPACEEYNNVYTDLDAGATSADSGLIVIGGDVTLRGFLGNSIVPCTTLSVTPTAVALTVTSIPTTGAITYTATPTTTFVGTFGPSNCYTGNAPALWTVSNPTIATISAGGVFTLVDPVPGVVNVVANAGNFNTAASPSAVTVVVNAVDTSAAPSGVTAASFTAGTVADSINVLYPYPNTVLPLGQLPPTVQWDNLGTAATAIKIQLRYPAGTGAQFTWSGIMPELETSPTPLLAAAPRAFIPQAVWTAFEQAAAGNTADFVIQRIVGGVVRKPNPATSIVFATGQLKGTVYYQSYGTNLATNYPGALVTGGGTKNFGAATLAIQQGASSPILIAGDNSNCRVCHSVAANGSALVTQSTNNAEADSYYYNLATLAQTDLGPATGGTNAGYYAWPAISPDGTYLFSNCGNLSGVTTYNNSGLYTLPGVAPVAVTGLPASFGARTPSFSPDASHLAFQFFRGTAGTPSTTADQVSLASMDYAHATQTFSNFQVLATPGANLGGTGGTTIPGVTTIYYPSYLTTGTAIVWHLEVVNNGRDPGGTRSQCDGIGCYNNNEGTHAELWWTDVATKKSARLANLNGTGYLPLHPTYAGEATTAPSTADPVFNYEPTVLPVAAGGYNWVVFTSRRRYGNIATINPFWSDPRYQTIDRTPTTKKLWVSAVNPNAAPGTDPSYPAFYIAGQELLAGNSRGYWVLNACAPAGTTSASLCTVAADCCSSEVCTLDAPPAQTAHCLALTSPVCVPDNSACTASIQCCGYPTSLCAQSICQAPVLNYLPASFTYDYQAVNCPSGTTATWTDAGLMGNLATNGGTYSSITLSVQVGPSAASLSPTTPVTVGTMTGPPVSQSSTWTNYDLFNLLASLGPGNNTQPYLRLKVTLTPSSNGLAAPQVVAWRARYDCDPSQ